MLLFFQERQTWTSPRQSLRNSRRPSSRIQRRPRLFRLQPPKLRCFPESSRRRQLRCLTPPHPLRRLDHRPSPRFRPRRQRSEHSPNNSQPPPVTLSQHRLRGRPQRRSLQLPSSLDLSLRWLQAAERTSLSPAATISPGQRRQLRVTRNLRPTQKARRQAKESRQRSVEAAAKYWDRRSRSDQAETSRRSRRPSIISKRTSLDTTQARVERAAKSK